MKDRIFIRMTPEMMKRCKKVSELSGFLLEGEESSSKIFSLLLMYALEDTQRWKRFVKKFLFKNLIR